MRKRRNTAVKWYGSHPIRVEYIPPTDTMIYQYARQLCERLAENDPSFASFEIRNGLSGFLKLVASLSAKQKNKKGSVEETEEKRPKPDESLDSQQ